MGENHHEEILVFGGSGSPKLTQRICNYLKVRPGRSEVLRFSDGNLFVRILESVRGHQVYLVQSTGRSPNDLFMELLFWIDAFQRAGAEKITVIVPYFSYAKGDKKDEPRVSIRARVCAEAIESLRPTRLVFVDLHAPQIQGFFCIPVDDLYALPVLCDAVRHRLTDGLVIVSPDAGFTKKAEICASYLGAPMAIGYKRRVAHDEKAEIMQIIGDVEGRQALVVDDFVASGGTLIGIAEKLLEQGAREVYAAVSHCVATTEALNKLNSSCISRLLVTDTVELPTDQAFDKIEVVTLAPLLAEAIRRIHFRESLSPLFPLQ